MEEEETQQNKNKRFSQSTDLVRSVTYNILYIGLIDIAFSKIPKYWRFGNLIAVKRSRFEKAGNITLRSWPILFKINHS